jgi:hypothetical protein
MMLRPPDRAVRRTSPTRRAAGAFAGLYVLLVVLFAMLSGRVVFGVLVAVPTPSHLR